MLRALVKSIGPLRRAYLKRAMAAGVSGQSDEGVILRRLSQALDAPKNFIEFGFHVREFNCAALVGDHAGLLIDGNAQQVEDARIFLPATIRVERQFITLDTLELIRTAFNPIGILSIDVDGNDYWFLEALIDTEPAIIVIEYNPSFGTELITVPYDSGFDRAKKHASGWYHGASLAALAKLAARHGYGLAAISEAGGNAFFTKSGVLDPATAWKPSRLRDEMAKNDREAQWAAIQNMPYVQV